MRILLAEDETIIRLDLRELIERAGFEVCAEAKDGEEAVELARREQPDLAILDVKMPLLDGIEAARRILAERPIPIVMLTAYAQEDLVARAVEAGVFGYLVKPFRETDLLPAIHTAKARHEELAALREEADSLAEALATRKLVERAKGLLMEREGLTEQEAFSRLRRASQISGRPMRVVADALIATFEELVAVSVARESGAGLDDRSRKATDRGAARVPARSRRGDARRRPALPALASQPAVRSEPARRGTRSGRDLLPSCRRAGRAIARRARGRSLPVHP